MKCDCRHVIYSFIHLYVLVVCDVFFGIRYLGYDTCLEYVKDGFL